MTLHIYNTYYCLTILFTKIAAMIKKVKDTTMKQGHI